MEIRKINESTIKCYISPEDLKKGNINYDDFVKRTDRVKKFIDAIIARAALEEDFQLSGNRVDISIVGLGEEGISLTVSTPQRKYNSFAELTEDLDNLDDYDEMPDKEETEKRFKELVEFVKEKEKRQKPSAKKQPEEAVFLAYFKGMSDLIAYARTVPKQCRAESALYEYEGKLFLLVSKAGASLETYLKMISRVDDFGYKVQIDTSTMLIVEHGELLIEEKALKVLA